MGGAVSACLQGVTMFLDFSVKWACSSMPQSGPFCKGLELARMYVFWDDTSDSTTLLKLVMLWAISPYESPPHVLLASHSRRKTGSHTLLYDRMKITAFFHLLVSTCFPEQTALFYFYF